jgi:hypothetical protein
MPKTMAADAATGQGARSLPRDIRLLRPRLVGAVSLLASLDLSASNHSSACIQYTLRNVAPHLDRALRHRAHEERKSLNEVTLDALLQAFALRGEELKRRDLGDVVGTWIDDPEVDRALEEQKKIDPELWR